MKEEKFTKGGWNFNPEEEVDDSMVITDDNYKPIAYLETNSVFDGSGYINQLTDEQDANAHLIAAAPEMYAMLNKLRLALENQVELNLLVSKNYEDETAKLASDAYELLAKARGEA